MHDGDLDCPLCLRLLHKPTTTPCGHSFCRNCLLQAARFQARCPLCRAELPPADSGPENSPVARFAVNTVLQSLAARQPDHSARVVEDIEEGERVEIQLMEDARRRDAEGAERDACLPEFSCLGGMFCGSPPRSDDTGGM
jgi:Zinc finger, C3HC4 type (RING finger)